MTAVTVVGGRQVITLAPRRLVVGIRVQGTIGHIDPQNPSHIRPRPYLTYFAETLRKLKCDVTLVLPGIGIDASSMMRAFSRHDFPVPYRYVVDAAPKMSSGGGHGNRKPTLAPVNYGNFFQITSEAAGSDSARVLFVDAEVNYRFTPTQTLILEEYEPLTHRQLRQLVRGELAMSPEQAARYGLQTHRDARRQRHLLSVAEGIEKVRRDTDFLAAEVHEARSRVAAKAMTDGGSGRWLGRHGGPRISDTAPAGLEKRQADAEKNRQLRMRAVVRESGAPVAADAFDLEWDVRGSAADEPAASAARHDEQDVGEGDTPGRSTTAAPSGSGSSNSSAAATSLAINMEDYTLVALAEMVAEIAAADTRVSEYLKMEPLIEKLNVPGHGTAFYLPIENCDDMDLLNWDAIHVQERGVQETKTVPDVEETEEHRDFFQ